MLKYIQLSLIILQFQYLLRYIVITIPITNVYSPEVRQVLDKSPSNDLESLKYTIISSLFRSGYSIRIDVAKTDADVVKILTTPRSDTAVMQVIIMPNGSLSFNNKIYTPQR